MNLDGTMKISRLAWPITWRLPERSHLSLVKQALTLTMPAIHLRSWSKSNQPQLWSISSLRWWWEQHANCDLRSNYCLHCFPRFPYLFSSKAVEGWKKRFLLDRILSLRVSLSHIREIYNLLSVGFHHENIFCHLYAFNKGYLKGKKIICETVFSLCALSNTSRVFWFLFSFFFEFFVTVTFSFIFICSIINS